MKILVTGGCGFIGSTLVDRLIDKGYQVTVIDNESAENHKQFYYNSKAHYYKYDIADYVNTRSLYNNVDYVFHCAAEARIQPAILNPILAVRTNVLGTETVLQCSREAGVKKVIYSSTSSAYGLKNKIPLSEDMPNDCLNPYSVSKVAGEELCKMYNRLFGLKTVIFRYFNVYGPREAGKGQYAPVVALFLRQLSEGNPLTIIGDGHQRRDFTYIDDVVNANLMAIEVEHVHYGEVFNIGSGVNYSVLELASMISSNQTFIPARIGEGRETLANTTKAQTVLGWKPTVNIKDYIKEQLAK